MRALSLILGACIALGAASVAAQQPEAKQGPERWEPDIAKFEEEDRKSPPEKGHIVFAGSSTIRLCEPHRLFPHLHILNRGFGGSEIADTVHYAERIILPHAPRVIVFHAGGNDIAAGKEPEAVCADFGAFVRKVHKALPHTRIIYMSLMGTRSRWALWPAMAKANALIEEFCKGDDRLWYVDMSRFLLDDNKDPREELFRSDKLHLNDEGYRIWAAVLAPVLQRMLWRGPEAPRAP